VDTARVAALLVRLFSVPYTLRGTSYLLHRLGFTPAARRRRIELGCPASRLLLFG